MIITILRKHHLSCVFQSFASSLRLVSTGIGRSSLTSPAISDLLLHKHQFSPQLASKVACRVKDPERTDSILSFLKESGFSNAQLQKIVKLKPEYLSASLEDTIKPKIRFFQGLGFCSDDIAKIISSNAVILHLKLDNRVIPSLSMLKNLLGTNDAVAKVLRKSAWLLHVNLEKTMVPNIEFLKSCNVPMDRILKLLCSQPRSLLLKPEIFRKSVQKAEEMGVNRSSNMFIYAVRVVSQLSGRTLELKLQAFRSWGFTDSEIEMVFQKAPVVFAGSIDKLKRTTDILRATGKYDISSIVDNPTSLMCSIAQRYKPRFQILEILERKNLINNWPSLGTLYQMSDERFFAKFVGPYLSEVGEVCAAKWSARQTRENKALT